MQLSLKSNVHCKCYCFLVSWCSDGVWDPEKWHASPYPPSERSSPVDGYKKDFADDRVPLKRRIPGKPCRTTDHSFIVLAIRYVLQFNWTVLSNVSLDPRERLKEDDLDVILSPQRRSFGGGCQGSAVLPSHSRRPVSPLENKENESLRMGSTRRIGSGRIIAARAFEREARAEKEREREREFKDKRFRVSVFQLTFLCSLTLRQCVLKLSQC